jgi:hypothetical protein
VCEEARRRASRTIYCFFIEHSFLSVLSTTQETLKKQAKHEISRILKLHRLKRKDLSMKKRISTLLLASTLLAALLFALTGLIGGGHAAYAAAARPQLSACQSTPNDANCDGQSPETTGCGADGTTLTSIGVGTGTVAVRFSPTCKSAWAHATNGAIVVIQATITRATDNLSYSSAFLTGTAAKSPMVYIGGHQAVQACAYINGTSRCTNLVTY